MMASRRRLVTFLVALALSAPALQGESVTSSSKFETLSVDQEHEWARDANFTTFVVLACGGGGGGGGAGGARNEFYDNGGGGGGGAGSPMATVRIENLSASRYFLRIGSGGGGGGGGVGGGNSGNGSSGRSGADTVFGPSVDFIPGTNVRVDPRIFIFPGGAAGSGGTGPAPWNSTHGTGGAGGAAATVASTAGALSTTPGGRGGDANNRGSDGGSWEDAQSIPKRTVAGGLGADSVGQDNNLAAIDGGGGGGGGAGIDRGGNGGIGGWIYAVPGTAPPSDPIAQQLVGRCGGGGGGGANGEANLNGAGGGRGGDGYFRIVRVP